jgi:hypothetical protein
MVVGAFLNVAVHNSDWLERHRWPSSSSAELLAGAAKRYPPITPIAPINPWILANSRALDSTRRNAKSVAGNALSLESGWMPITIQYESV